MLALVLIIAINNFLNFIIESLSAETELSFLPIIAFAGTLFGLNHFNIINISEALSKGVIAVSENPVLLSVPVAILVALYFYNFKCFFSLFRIYIRVAYCCDTQNFLDNG